MTTTNNTIEKHADLRAPIARVWRALSDSQEFGSWFGVKLDGPFQPGKTAAGHITSKGYEHVRAEFHVDRVDERNHTLVFRWRPYAIEPNVDYSHEPYTVVTLALSEIPTGTHLAITETGFDGIPAARRAKAFEMNSSGWQQQTELIAAYLAKHVENS
jgi:uncharacterized protein YndB with AHSA1/START domain